MKKTFAAVSIVMACYSGFSYAEVRINGFANIVAGKSSSGDSLYGFTDDVSFSEQSLFAIQISGNVNDKLTATAQVLARGENDYSANFEWAYMTYQATDNLSVSAGRLRLPLFRYSASLDVGYSYHWITAPNAVYSVPFNNLDGVRVDYANYVGDFEYNLQFAAGTFQNSLIIGELPSEIEGKNVWLSTFEGQYNSFKARGVIGHGSVSITNPTLEQAFGGLAQISAGLSDDVAFNEDSSLFYGVGLEYDNFTWFVSGEYTVVEAEETFLPKQISYYLSAGIRLGAFTPSITFERSDALEDFKFVDQIGSLPAPFRPTATQIVLGTQIAQQLDEETLTLGVRYDLDTNVALKLDISKQTDDLKPANRNASIVRFAVNYVF